MGRRRARGDGRRSLGGGAVGAGAGAGRLIRTATHASQMDGGRGLERRWIERATSVMGATARLGCVWPARGAREATGGTG
ncbi:hypothetical protein BDV59DRAFT_187815 [Aspergillus ambiguus]|uniref:uncharacterized protein n=1 Tax=Aspergillus ambiguus TaxID=176160 RepID=UPI003CCCA51C